MNFYLITLLLWLPAGSTSQPFSPKMLNTAKALQEQALEGSRAFEILESLTTEVGPRLAGTPGDTAAVAWAQAKLGELGFDKVWTEEVTFPAWVRGSESCRVLSPFPQPLQLTALGNSVGTPDQGIEAEVVEVADLDSLKAQEGRPYEGKIVFINNAMERTKTGRGYGRAVVARTTGAAEAAQRGALAVLIRSIGTDSHRFPHTGTMKYDAEIRPIPAAALSNPDANLLANMIQRGQPVRLQLNMSSRQGGMFTSHNVIAEIKGREKPNELILLGAHLDSWDLGTGALDDGAGVAIVTEAARLISTLPQRPRRTIRVVLFANEEGGLYGAKAYAERHKNDLHHHIVAAESDFGAGLIWAFSTNVNDRSLPAMSQIASTLAALGIEPGNNETSGGPDVGPLHKLGVPVVSLHQDGSDYFDYHHTADDTLDKADPKKMDQNVAAYATFAYLMADSALSLRQAEPGPSLQSE